MYSVRGWFEPIEGRFAKQSILFKTDFESSFSSEGLILLLYLVEG